MPRKRQIRTWHWELLVVSVVLCGVTVFFANDLVNWITTLAILLTFQHAQIGDRLQERQGRMDQPTVECYWKLNKLFAGKEFLWIIAFLLMRNYAAIAGSVLFFLYPFWRKIYRAIIKPFGITPSLWDRSTNIPPVFPALGRVQPYPYNKHAQFNAAADLAIEKMKQISHYLSLPWWIRVLFGWMLKIKNDSFQKKYKDKVAEVASESKVYKVWYDRISVLINDELNQDSFWKDPISATKSILTEAVLPFDICIVGKLYSDNTSRYDGDQVKAQPIRVDKFNNCIEINYEFYSRSNDIKMFLLLWACCCSDKNGFFDTLHFDFEAISIMHINNHQFEDIGAFIRDIRAMFMESAPASVTEEKRANIVCDFIKEYNKTNTKDVR